MSGRHRQPSHLLHGPLARYVKLRVAHALEMRGTFSPPPRVSNTDMHRGTCVTHVSWCMPGSLNIGFLWIEWRWKRSRHSRRMRNPLFYVSGKRPMAESLVGVSRCGHGMNDTYRIHFIYRYNKSQVTIGRCMVHLEKHFICKFDIMENVLIVFASVYIYIYMTSRDISRPYFYWIQIMFILAKCSSIPLSINEILTPPSSCQISLSEHVRCVVLCFVVVSFLFVVYWCDIFTYIREGWLNLSRS